jgi:hypothetical protein
MLDVLPQLVANDGLRTLRAAIADPRRYAIEPKIDGVRGLIVFRPDGVVETPNRRGQVRDWQRHRPFASGLVLNRASEPPRPLIDLRRRPAASSRE